MNQVTMTNIKTLKVAELKELLPFEVIADGIVIAVVQEKWAPKKAKTQCPNCKLVYDYTEPDGKPFFFTMKRGQV